MPPGGNRLLSFSPPGAIGLIDDNPAVMLRLDEEVASIRPKDSAGSLSDLRTELTLTAPAVVDGATGRARRCVPTSTTGMISNDLVSGASLFTRDVSVQAIVSFNASAQATHGTGCIVARGKGTSAAEYAPYALEVGVVDLASRLYRVNWTWHDLTGTVKAQAAVQFTAPVGFTMITATRRWLSPTSVVLRYYIGDELLAEVASVDGSIGGSTTGTFSLGCRLVGAVYSRFFAGDIDEVMVMGRELTAEEVESTWLRMSVFQPLGEQLFREMHDPGFPLPNKPDADVTLDTRMTGHALGLAASHIEGLRSYALPQRAFGQTLADWEEVTRVTPQPADSVDQRRERVLARLRQRRGVSLDGLRDVLQGVIGGADPLTDLEFIAFDNTVREGFQDLDPNPLLWDITPALSFEQGDDTARAQPVAGTYTMNGITRSWLRMRMAMGGNSKQAIFQAKLSVLNTQNNLDVGIYFEQASANDFLLLGMRNQAGVIQVITESFVGGISQGVVVHATLGAGNPAAIWLRLIQTPDDGVWRALWSIAGPTSGFSSSVDIDHPEEAHWAGIYLRSGAGSLAAGTTVLDADDVIARTPFGSRPFNAYVLLDESLGFSPDVSGARSAVQSLRHAYTWGTFILKRATLCDDSESGCDWGPMGAV